MPYLPRLLFPHWPGRMGPTRFQPNLVESMAMAAPWKGSVRMKGKRYPHTAEKRTTRREPVGPRWNWASHFFDETFLFFFPKPSNPPRGTGPTAQAPDFFCLRRGNSIHFFLPYLPVSYNNYNCLDLHLNFSFLSPPTLLSPTPCLCPPPSAHRRAPPHLPPRHAQHLCARAGAPPSDDVLSVQARQNSGTVTRRSPPAPKRSTKQLEAGARYGAALGGRRTATELEQCGISNRGREVRRGAREVNEGGAGRKARGSFLLL
ncbi:hypothetical protein PVAP13_5KG661607 [Panicum virgatum]|uniref:Uncharacterized protein n=1 Tax=Panicum virgatum TaxID=38727 RepID=A0A8T0SVS3_PANVG|nr:hypothetical protein PVAP13_5KG661607 [Panicum virgatum]